MISFFIFILHQINQKCDQSNETFGKVNVLSTHIYLTFQKCLIESKVSFRPWTIIWQIDSRSKDLLKLGQISKVRYYSQAGWLQQTWQQCYWGILHDMWTTQQEWTTWQDRGFWSVYVKLGTQSSETNFRTLQYFTGRNTAEIRRRRIAAALRDGKSITLVKLLRAKYCADSCDTRWTKPLPAACPSQRWWAFSLSLPSSASRLATSSSTHWTSTKQVEDECGGKNDKATGSGWANDWREMFGEVVWKCSQKKEDEEGMEEKHRGGLMCYRTDELTGEHSNTRHG